MGLKKDIKPISQGLDEMFIAGNNCLSSDIVTDQPKATYHCSNNNRN